MVFLLVVIIERRVTLSFSQLKDLCLVKLQVASELLELSAFEKVVPIALLHEHAPFHQDDGLQLVFKRDVERNC
jgi:hypothetical protein